MKKTPKAKAHLVFLCNAANDGGFQSCSNYKETCLWDFAPEVITCYYKSGKNCTNKECVNDAYTWGAFNLAKM